MKLISHKDRNHRDSFITSVIAKKTPPTFLALTGNGYALALLLINWRLRDSFVSASVSRKNPEIYPLLITLPAKSEAWSLCYLLGLAEKWKIFLKLLQKSTNPTYDVFGYKKHIPPMVKSGGKKHKVTRWKKHFKPTVFMRPARAWLSLSLLHLCSNWVKLVIWLRCYLWQGMVDRDRWILQWQILLT